MNGWFGFIFFGIVLGGLLLFLILWWNNRKDKKISNKIEEEMNMYRYLGMREGKKSEESIKEYMQTLKGGLIENGRRENESNRGTTAEISNSSKPTAGDNQSNEPIIRNEIRRDIPIEPSRSNGGTINSSGKIRKSVEINWE